MGGGAVPSVPLQLLRTRVTYTFLLFSHSHTLTLSHSHTLTLSHCFFVPRFAFCLFSLHLSVIIIRTRESRSNHRFASKKMPRECQRSHPLPRPPRSYPDSYVTDLWRLHIDLGHLAPTGCPEAQNHW